MEQMMDTSGHNPVTYQSYLKIDELLNLQHLLSEHHDEMLFILIHQVYELWFKCLLHELQAFITCLEQDNLPRALKVLKRMITVQKVLVNQIDVLETMTPTEFAEFRDNLRPASGFQSLQFRELEFKLGAKQPRYLMMFASIPEAQSRLQACMDGPTAYDYLLKSMARQGYEVPESVLKRDTKVLYESHPEVLACFEKLYKDPQQDYQLYQLCEALLDIDEHFSLWRYRHVKMVERTIGSKAGTGGSSGAQYLRSTLDIRFFPELWEVRAKIGSY